MSRIYSPLTAVIEGHRYAEGFNWAMFDEDHARSVFESLFNNPWLDRDSVWCVFRESACSWRLIDRRFTMTLKDVMKTLHSVHCQVSYNEILDDIRQGRLKAEKVGKGKKAYQVSPVDFVAWAREIDRGKE